MIASKRLAEKSILSRPQRFSARSTTRKDIIHNCGHNKRACSRNNSGYSFLTEGYQPTARELLTYTEFGYDISEFSHDSKENRILPVLDASVVL